MFYTLTKYGITEPIGNTGIIYSVTNYRDFLSALLDGYITTIVYSKYAIDNAYELKLPQWNGMLKFKYRLERIVAYNGEYMYRLVNVEGIKKKMEKLNNDKTAIQT